MRARDFRAADRSGRIGGAPTLSALSIVLNSASFFAPLTSSLLLSKGAGTFTFSRASTATVMGYSPGALPGDAQVMLTCAAGEARFEGARRVSQGVWSEVFADGTPIPAATLKSVLLESAPATNLCVAMDQASWSGTTVSTVLLPDGATYARQFNYGASGTPYIGHSYNRPANHTASIFAKAGTNTTRVWLSGAYAVNQEVQFNLIAGTVETVTGAGVTGKITPYPNGFYRCEVFFPVADGAFDIVVSPKNVATATANTPITAAGTIYLGWPQTQSGAEATSVIPTTTVAVTRAGDSLSFQPAAGIPINNFTISFEYSRSLASATGLGQSTPIAIGNYASGAYVGLGGYFGSGATILGAWTQVWDIAASPGFVVPDSLPVRMACSFLPDGKTIHTAANGQLYSPVASVAARTIAWSGPIYIGAQNNVVFRGNVKNLRLWQYQLTDAQLQQVTA